MIDTIFGIFGILGIYLLGTWSGLFVAALIIANRDREDMEEDEWQDVFKDGSKQKDKD
jgi:hypothetical protein